MGTGSDSGLAWPPGDPRVLITDGWLTNAGDAAIALGTERLIRRHAPGAAVLHAAYGVELVGDRYAELALLPPLDALLGTRWTRATVDGGDRLVAGADLVISQGGGFLREEYRPWDRLDALDRAVSTGVPLVLLGQTIGRFDLAFARRTLGAVLRAAAAVVVRDPRSRAHAIEMGADAAATVLGTDVALALVDGPGPRTDPDPPVVVVLSDHAVGWGQSRRTARASLAVDVLAAALATHPGRRIEVWSSAQGAGDDHDELVADTAIEALAPKDRDRLHHVRDHVDARQVVARTGDAAAVVSMRFHPALLAAAQGTPTVLLLDDQKADAVAGTSLAGNGIKDIAQPRPPDLADLPGRLRQVEALVAKQLASPGTRP